MITTENFKDLLTKLGFAQSANTYKSSFGHAELSVDFDKQRIAYPENRGLKINRREICNFSSNENFVVFECVHRLLKKGYKPEHLELEARWKVGHGASGGRADILVKDQQNKPLLLIECKTIGSEFEQAWKSTQQNGGQLFSYAQQIQDTQFLCLYASDFVDGRVHTEQRIIPHKDNSQILEQNQQLNSFAKATDVKNRFAVWRDTYQLEYTESGIFEQNVQSYQIGKSKYTLAEDTKAIAVKDKKGKYHQFRTILRKHNIARRENAFEVLVNLFLCKIVDEESNSDDLKFYWKGIAYDNYFDFVDRLQDLYQRGMRQFLNQEISYISNEQIKSAFWAVKNDRNATKKQIQEYFRELKFYTNSAFSFIDTHNKSLFDRNAKVLLEVVQMWQGLRLKTEQQNQFLGDMFEYFLDNSIKQSNGQFFTPLPICKFIVASLPLAEKITAADEPLRTIDYACGSGHFLTEYAYQIQALVATKKHQLQDYYRNIIGVEKEDRLAKVAKIASFMYGQKQIKILDADALAEHPEIPRESFDVLVANPPFAVEGFLQTLSDADKASYELIQASGENSDTNTIQCFFLERIRHLMAPGGVVGVIVPSSILSNSDAVHTRTREIILRFFEVVSIAELGSGTFGKTGTNTVVLFLCRRDKKPEAAEHYANRVEDFFDLDTKENGDRYQDSHLLKSYCKYVEVPYEAYKKLFGANDFAQIAELLQVGIFQDYQTKFNKTQRSKKAKSSADRQHSLLDFIRDIEKQKLLYFILAHEQRNNVLIVHAPKNNAEQKRFLGYEWGSRKGSEGIKYLGGETVNHIITPMFDPKDLNNDEKINTAIRNNFAGKTKIASLPEHCRLLKLVDMLDFSRTDFHKTINLNPQVKAAIESKWELAKIGALFELENGIPSGEGKSNYLEIGDVDIATKRYDISQKKKQTVNGAITVPKNTLLISTVRPTRGAITITTNEINVSNAFCKIKLQNKYLFHILNQPAFFEYLGNVATGVQYPACKTDDILNFKIPNPPANVQQQIADECDKADSQTEHARQSVVVAKQQIAEKVRAVINSGYEMKIGALFELENGIPSGEGKSNYLEIGDVDIATKRYDISQKKKQTVKGAITVPQNTLLISTVRPTRGAITITTNEINVSNAFCKIKLQNKYLYHILNQPAFFEYLGSVATGVQYPVCKTDDILNFKIPNPPLDVQQQLVDEVEKLESEITKAQSVIAQATSRKNEILQTHLMD